MTTHFTFFASYYDSVERLDSATKGEFFDVLFKYALRDELPSNDVSAVVFALFTMAKPNIDKSQAKREAGQAGGKQTASKPQAKEKQTASKSEKDASDKEIGEGIGEGIGDMESNTPKSYDSEKDFSLSRDTHYDNLSKDYKDALQVFIESMGLSYPFDDFVNSLQAKASYKYKNFVKTYRTWAKNYIPKQAPQQRMDISKLPEGVSLQDMLNEAGEQWEREQEQKQIGGVR